MGGMRLREGQWPVTLSVAAGVLPAVVSAGFTWAVSAGALAEFGTVGFGVSMLIIIGWWMGVTLGVMVAASGSGKLYAGVLVGALSTASLLTAVLLARPAEERADALLAPGTWLGALLIIAIPTIIGLLFAEKQIKRSGR